MNSVTKNNVDSLEVTPCSTNKRTALPMHPSKKQMRGKLHRNHIRLLTAKIAVACLGVTVYLLCSSIIGHDRRSIWYTAAFRLLYCFPSILRQYLHAAHCPWYKTRWNLVLVSEGRSTHAHSNFTFLLSIDSICQCLHALYESACLVLN